MPNRRILILDDDASVGQTIQWIAESLGFEAEFVTRPEEFFSKLVEMNPDIITIDLVMPELDGVEIMRLLAERKSRAKIIISSGMGTRVLDAARRSAQEHGLGIAGIISKPISKDALRQLIGEGSECDQPLSAEKESGRGNEFEITKADLQNALDRHEFVLAYQPKIECMSGATAGLEALARWQNPDMGMVMPDKFIPVAEETGLIDDLTAQVFDQSLEWFSGAFPESNLLLSLNLSAKSLVDIQLADHLATLCQRFKILPERIVLELTETSAMVDPILSLDLMTRIRMKGFQLSLDDFGTGYSSMIQLVRLPFSEIKVDKSFVLLAKQTKESLNVIKSIVDLGHSLGLRVTAEGVDDLSTLTYLNTLGCDLAQGYFIARPMSGEAARSWAQQRMSLSES
ncbi:MAG: EAL domain-containing response regulator [Terracidiphilus sp.]|jgi:EAL domain-containing protein (putative c-di-GMP-specific phosphodiesterase class I)/FixJ family two-component response regulator